MSPVIYVQYALPRFIVVLLLGFATHVSAKAAGNVIFTEDFTSLDQWEPLTFPSIPRHSVYRIKEGDDGRAYLEMESENAGSGLVSRESFDPFEYPVIEWRWRVDEAIVGVDHTERSGDDYPVRVYISVGYTGSGLGLIDRLRYNAYRARHGEYPPHSALTYLWTATPVGERIYRNPYAERVGMIVLRDDNTPLGEWRNERIHFIEDYKQVFGEAPPPSPIRIAIMTDSDDTGQSTRAAVDYIRILRKR